ncbi:MAG: DUF2851 family protein [Rhodothermales bacterium]
MPSTYFYGFSDDVLEVVLHEPKSGLVPEALVQDIWLNRRITRRGLSTTDGTSLEVLYPGRLNTDAGPDFLGARLRMGPTLWNGAVEIHVTSGSWLDHRHGDDPRYNATVLHVTLYADMWTGRLRRADGSTLPELVLYPLLEERLRSLLRAFYLRTEQRIYCAGGWDRVPDAVRARYLRELAMERTVSRSRRFASGDAHQVFYEATFAGLGYAKNAQAMRTLAQTVPLEACRTVSESADIEALYLGCSGLLPQPAALLEADRATADYVMELHDRFDRLRHRLALTAMPASSWRFFRLRPANFPPLRIAQAAALLRPDGLPREDPMPRLSAAARVREPLAALRAVFDVRLDPFWDEHFRLEKRTTPHSSRIGRQRIDALLINVVVPALLALARQAGEDDEACWRLLEQLPAGSDEVTRLFDALGTRPGTAVDSQGLHQLYRTRCSQARCLSCRIGEEVLARIPRDT